MFISTDGDRSVLASLLDFGIVVRRLAAAHTLEELLLLGSPREKPYSITAAREGLLSWTLAIQACAGGA